jgi:hypothetical protein
MASWSCIVRCHVVCGGGTVQYAEGKGSGKSEEDAVKSAKEDVDKWISENMPHAAWTKMLQEALQADFMQQAFARKVVPTVPQNALACE